VNDWTLPLNPDGDGVGTWSSWHLTDYWT
jgi:hypothetical protein